MRQYQFRKPDGESVSAFTEHVKRAPMPLRNNVRRFTYNVVSDLASGLPRDVKTTVQRTHTPTFPRCAHALDVLQHYLPRSSGDSCDLDNLSTVLGRRMQRVQSYVEARPVRLLHSRERFSYNIGVCYAVMVLSAGVFGRRVSAVEAEDAAGGGVEWSRMLS